MSLPTALEPVRCCLFQAMAAFLLPAFQLFMNLPAVRKKITKVMQCLWKDYEGPQIDLDGAISTANIASSLTISVGWLIPTLIPLTFMSTVNSLCVLVISTRWLGVGVSGTLGGEDEFSKESVISQEPPPGLAPTTETSEERRGKMSDIYLKALCYRMAKHFFTNELPLHCIFSTLVYVDNNFHGRDLLLFGHPTAVAFAVALYATAQHWSEQLQSQARSLSFRPSCCSRRAEAAPSKTSHVRWLVAQIDNVLNFPETDPKEEEKSRDNTSAPFNYAFHLNKDVFHTPKLFEADIASIESQDTTHNQMQRCNMTSIYDGCCQECTDEIPETIDNLVDASYADASYLTQKETPTLNGEIEMTDP